MSDSLHIVCRLVFTVLPIESVGPAIQHSVPLIGLPHFRFYQNLYAVKQFYYYLL